MPFVLIVASCAIAERRCDGERGSAEARCHSWSLRQRRHCRRGGASLSPRVVAIETETVTAKARHCCWVVTGGSHRCQCRHRSYHCSVPVFFLSTVLKSYGHIDVHQEQPYGDIRLNLQRAVHCCDNILSLKQNHISRGITFSREVKMLWDLNWVKDG
ncbi:uncharacterized protein LOC127740655 isoform X2 [Arachis duranensis]|uniref:Uncharacterized protein LOC127740655 isoform X2 n=1 Tax=Arachis duranensis TaxID=130453 RepID=A0A9C6TFP8_ARADU|nr:uncharacterized protein LOC127740655 isoform X2 [Arachis duranensis]